MTPPEKADETDNGLLTASEIAQLKLNAESVILSACNTAAGAAEGREALSGLAKGARFILAAAMTRPKPINGRGLVFANVDGNELAIAEYGEVIALGNKPS